MIYEVKEFELLSGDTTRVTVIAEVAVAAVFGVGGTRELKRSYLSHRVADGEFEIFYLLPGDRD